MAPGIIRRLSNRLKRRKTVSEKPTADERTADNMSTSQSSKANEASSSRPNTAIGTTVNRNGRPMRRFEDYQKRQNERTNQPQSLERQEPTVGTVDATAPLSLRDQFLRDEFLYDVQTASLSEDMVYDIGVAVPMLPPSSQQRDSSRRTRSNSTVSERRVLPGEAPQIGLLPFELQRRSAVRGTPEERKAREERKVDLVRTNTAMGTNLQRTPSAIGRTNSVTRPRSNEISAGSRLPPQHLQQRPRVPSLERPSRDR